MVVKGFPLIKFQSRELIESLQNGLIYMNSLEWFRNNESDYAYCMFGVNPYSKNFSFTSEQKKNIQSFGNTALLILDKDEFFNRLRAAALKEGYEIYGGFVHYYDETQDSVDYIASLLSGMHNVAFWKRKKYYYQQEFRFLIHAQNHDKDHLELNIGDIRDISKVFQTSKILNAEVVKI